MQIWIVMGSTGEYSDRGEWVVEAARTEEAAKARVTRLEGLLRELGAESGDYDTRRAARDGMRSHAEGDPHCDIDYTGTRYWFEPCELRD